MMSALSEAYVFSPRNLSEAPVIVLPRMCFPHGFKQKNITNTQRLQQLSHPVRTYDV